MVLRRAVRRRQRRHRRPWCETRFWMFLTSDALSLVFVTFVLMYHACVVRFLYGKPVKMDPQSL
jgi:hypothetical protein